MATNVLDMSCNNNTSYSAAGTYTGPALIFDDVKIEITSGTF